MVLRPLCEGGGVCSSLSAAISKCSQAPIPTRQKIHVLLRPGRAHSAQEEECDSPEMQRIYQLAADYRVPVLMHWQYKRCNYGFKRFYRMIEKYPKTPPLGTARKTANQSEDFAEFQSWPGVEVQQRSGRPGRGSQRHNSCPSSLKCSVQLSLRG